MSNEPLEHDRTALSPGEIGAIVARWCLSQDHDEPGTGPAIAWLTPAHIATLMRHEEVHQHRAGMPPPQASA